ncbi:TfoX/Sxy family protein [Brachybacterium hainanense]|uniref:TfoX/Sxy family protein n=1 Tax=Brachybacterium hainanense TaxID=1541174 RepID=A0ABV6RFA0_9MICO
MSIPEAQAALLARIRALLPPDAALREVSMFGGRALMLEGRMLVSAGKDGSLLVRIDPSWHGELLEHPGAGPAMMGAARPMGEGWITVDAAALAEDAPLAEWIETARRFHEEQRRS